MHRAGAASAHAAAELGAGELRVIAQVPEERPRGVAVEGGLTPVQGEANHRDLPHDHRRWRRARNDISAMKTRTMRTLVRSPRSPRDVEAWAETCGGAAEWRRDPAVRRECPHVPGAGRLWRCP